MANTNRYTFTNPPPFFYVPPSPHQSSPQSPPQSPILYTTQPSFPITSYHSPSSSSSSSFAPPQRLVSRTRPQRHQRHNNVQPHSRPRPHPRPQSRSTIRRAPRAARSLDFPRSNMLLAQLRRNQNVVRNDVHFHEPVVVTVEEQMGRLRIDVAVEEERQRQRQQRLHGGIRRAEMQGIEEGIQSLAIEARESGQDDGERREEEAGMNSLLYGIGSLEMEERLEVRWNDDGYEEMGFSDTESLEEEEIDSFEALYVPPDEIPERGYSARELEMDEHLRPFITVWQS
ncbi:hypothetical protein BKA63DRAFT_591138 [Paraphoma chrysanthemicola]|nr:hypothetical protein BKA63DRAFT_591138 [Paraphoma chrysanthemicola]